MLVSRHLSGIWRALIRAKRTRIIGHLRFLTGAIRPSVDDDLIELSQPSLKLRRTSWHTAPAALVINEEQAPVVRSIFEMFASGRFGLVTISRSLEERGVPTRMGRLQWNRNHIKSMLKNETYTGTRYFTD